MPTIVRRARLGNSTEDISYMGNGQMAVLDGYHLLLVPIAPTLGPRADKMQKLFRSSNELVVFSMDAGTV
jgi:hypothetical protein